MKEHLKVFQWLESVKPRVSKVTYQQYSNHIQILAKYARDNQKEIDTTTVEEWIRNLKEDKKLRGKTLSIYRSIAAGYLEHVAPGSSRPLKNLVLKSSPRKRDLFADSELDRIQEVANQDWNRHEGCESEWSTAVRIARATALRMGDVVTLRWDAILIEDRGIRLEPLKTKKHGKVSEVPISDELIAILSKRRLAITGDYVMPGLSHEYRTNGHNQISKHFLALAKKSGSPRKSFHLIRNTVITNWLKEGQSAEIISTITGQTVAQVMKYARLSLSDKRKALGL